MKRLVSLTLILCMIISICTSCLKPKEKEKKEDNGPEQQQNGETVGSASGEDLLFDGDSESRLARFISDYMKNASFTNLTVRGLPPETPQTGPVGQWDIPVPEINPLGTQSLYDHGAYYYKDGGIDLSYLDGSAGITRYISGENWQLSFSAQTGDVLPFLKEYASKIGAEVFDTVSDDSFAFRLKKQDSVWWCQVRSEYWDRYYLYVVKQKLFEMNREFKITPEQFDSSGAFRFLVDMPGKKFSLLKLSLPDGIVEVKSENTNIAANITTRTNYYSLLDAAHYKDYSLYDFPQDAGPVELVLQKHGNDPLPSEVTFCMKETEYSLPGYKPGGLGTLVVKNAPYGRVFVTPQQYVSITYDIASNRYYFTREETNVHSNSYGISSGDDIYYTLPAGYYTVVNLLSGELGRSRAQLIPVSAGEETTVWLPDSLRTATGVLMSSSDDRELTGSITIGEKKDMTTTAQLALSVSDPKERDIFPTKENTKITEGGKQVNITDIKREIAPCSVALVIDSSGSMKNDMTATIEAAKKFVESLPDNSFVKIIQFSSTVTPHQGETKTAALKALSGIRPVGATKLYDATVAGLNAVKGKTRPAVVVFTDGVDSREDGQGQGSTNTRDSVIQKIQEQQIPVYTIGFGKRLNEGESVTSVDGAPGSFAVFRVIEAVFDTRVQALLNINPAERIYLKFDTKSGELLTQLSDVTDSMPFGFSKEVMLAPASTNNVRLAYDIPAAMKNYASQLFFDLADTSAVFPVSQGQTLGAPSPVAEIDCGLYKVRINQLVKLPSQLNLPDKQGDTIAFGEGAVLLDVTFIDKPGNDGVIIPADFFSLVNKKYTPESGSGSAGTNIAAGRIGIGGGSGSSGEILAPSGINQSLVFGIGERFAVFEGHERRALVAFDRPSGDIADWTLQSKYTDSILVPVTSGAFSTPEMIAQKAEVTENAAFLTLLDNAVEAVVNKYAVLGDSKYTPVVKLETNDGYDNLVIPSINTHGLKLMKAATNEENVLRVLKQINCIPKLYRSNYSAESVLTQGFGDIASVTDTAMELFSNIGLRPERKSYSFTDLGVKLLSEFYGFDVKREGSFPIGITYKNQKGEQKVFVIPFMMDLSQLSGLVYRSSVEHSELDYPSDIANISVYAVFEPSLDGSVTAAAGSMGSALGGDEGGSKQSELLMLEKSIPLDQLSLDPLDLGFARVSGDGKTGYSAILTTPGEVVVGQQTLQDFAQIYGFRVVFSGLDKAYTHTATLAKGQKPENLLLTIGINLPDLPAKASATLYEAASKAHGAAKNPEPYTIARWYNRNILNNLISGQTTFDTEMIQTTDLVLVRISKPRCIVISSELDSSGNLTTWVDLLQPFNEVHAGGDELTKTYNLMNGFFQSSLESWLLTDGLKTGYIDTWLNAPEGAEILAIPVLDDGRDDLADSLEKENLYPPTLISAVRKNQKHLLFQSKPTQISGTGRFAWLELDPNTYEVISVFDNGYHGAEYFINTGFLKEGTLEFIKGTWLGINVSVWTVSFMNLKTQDVARIVLEGKIFALMVGEALAKFSDNWDAVKTIGEKIAEVEQLIYDMDEVAADLRTKTDGGGSGMDRIGEKGTNKAMDAIFSKLPKFRIFGVDMNEKAKNGFKGFSNGYITIVDAYFHFFSGSKDHVTITKEKKDGDKDNGSEDGSESEDEDNVELPQYEPK